MTRVLLLLVAYNNYSDIEAFLNDLPVPGRNARLDVALCDNSPSSGLWEPKHPLVRAVVRRPDNPGYLEGALLAFSDYVTRHGERPEWTILSNSDLKLNWEDVLTVLRARDPELPLMIAPRITEHRRDMNPHLYNKRPFWRHSINYGLTRHTGLAFVYLCGALVGLWVRRTHLLPSGSSMRRTAVAGDQMYSPYGAIVIMSRGYWAVAGIRGPVPLLAEEYALAEAARRAHVPIVYEPRIHVEHNPHSTTGASVSWGRAKLMRNAFHYIWCAEREARARE